MSDTEKHYGKLLKLKLDGNTLEHAAQLICESFQVPKTEDTWLDTLLDVRDKNYVASFYRINDDIYYLIEHKKFENDADFIQRNEDGTFTFYTEFYNGGTCLSEQIEYLIERAQKIENDGRNKTAF